MLFKLIPSSLKMRIRNAILKDVRAAKYFPYASGREFFIIPKLEEPDQDVSNGLAMPPKQLWIGGPTEEFYLYWGQKDVAKMLEIVEASHFSLNEGKRILEFGCREGRMIRHLKSFSDVCEVWGVDVSSDHIFWCKRHLDPPFHFATTTTIPHLPFQDAYFDFVYAGSIFTHIDDLAEAWLLELRRILSPDGRLYMTIHDKHTIDLLDKFANVSSPTHQQSGLEEFVSSRMASATWHSQRIYRENKHANFAMFAIGRDTRSQIFYDIDYFCKMLAPMFDIISITTEAYSEYQTAVLVKKRSLR